MYKAIFRGYYKRDSLKLNSAVAVSMVSVLALSVILTWPARAQTVSLESESRNFPTGPLPFANVIDVRGIASAAALVRIAFPDYASDEPFGVGGSEEVDLARVASPALSTFSSSLPVIQDVQAVAISSNLVALHVLASKPTVLEVWYTRGDLDQHFSDTKKSSFLVQKEHSLDITSLEPDTEYRLLVRVRDLGYSIAETTLVVRTLSAVGE